MEARKLSATEKGKKIATEPYQAPRRGRIQVQETENHYLIHKHSLTLIGKITNPSVQKVWSVINFFTEHWKTEKQPVGADLGQGLFQFQFELESDLLAVLDKRPYHYARWMIILQRWEPTTSPQFPSLIPFWIKVQGIPVHLWKEETIQQLGDDIGIFEEADITSLAVRMKVQINGRLPLLKQSVIEYSNGDEVTAYFVYEKLEKHCTMCGRLDHELRDCLEAKAREKERLNPHVIEEQGRAIPGPVTTYPIANTGAEISRYRAQPQRSRAGSKYTEETNEHRDNRRSYSTHRRPHQRNDHPYKRHDHGYTGDRSSHHYSSRYQHQRSHQEDNPRDMIYRPVSRSHLSRYDNLADHSVKQVGNQGFDTPKKRDEEANDNLEKNRTEVSSSARGVPLRELHNPVTQAALQVALGEVRDAMLQYTACADPTESAARKERMRQAEECGEPEETAIQMVRAAMITAEQPREEVITEVSPRVPALQRLGPAPIPDDLDAGPSNRKEKRKPGRPPGAKTVRASPLALGGISARKRKVQQPKAPSCKRKLGTTAPRIAKVGVKGKGKGGSSRVPEVPTGSNASSDNQPLIRLIPKNTRRKVDFPNPSTLVP